MADEAVTTSTEQGTGTVTQSEAPTDFREYTAWRATGELPEKTETPPVTEDGARKTAETPDPKTETAPDSEPDDNQETGESETDETPRKKRDSKDRKISYLERELTAARERLAQQPAAVEPGLKPTEPAPGKPKLEDFQTLEEYQESLTDWKLDQREKTRAEAEAKHARDVAEREAFETWAKREKAAKKAHEDYEDVMEATTIPDGPGVQAARLAMLESESGAEILYHLAKQPAELKRIAALSPVSAVREIGKLEAALTKSSSAPENGTPRITGAPKPPPPTGRPSKTSSDTPEEAAKRGDFRAYAKLRALERR